MDVFVKTVGILVACAVAVLAYNPAIARRIIGYFREGKRLYAAAGFRILLGALLIWGAFHCSITGVVLAIGILVLATGVVALAIGLARLQAFLDWWTTRSDNVLRLTMALAFLVGVALIYAA